MGISGRGVKLAMRGLKAETSFWKEADLEIVPVRVMPHNRTNLSPLREKLGKSLVREMWA
jgi:hypothetical protein